MKDGEDSKALLKIERKEHDKVKESLYHHIRMGDMEKQEYKKKYKGLDHSFYEKKWFKEIATEFGLKIIYLIKLLKIIRTQALDLM